MMEGMEQIYMRQHVEALLGKAKELALMGDFKQSLEIIEEAETEHKLWPKIVREFDELRFTVEPKVQAMERAAQKAFNRAKAKLEQKHDMKLREAAEWLKIDYQCRDESIIEKAYKRESLRHHPDRNRNDPDATDRFQQVNAARQAFAAAIAKGGPALSVVSASSSGSTSFAAGAGGASSSSSGTTTTNGTEYDAKAAAVAFKAMLRRREVPSTCSSWDELVDLCEDDPDFHCTLRTNGEKRQALSEYKTARAKEEKELERRDKDRARKAFVAALEESEAVSHKTPWENASIVLSREPRFLAIEDVDERKALYDDWRHQAKLKRKEEKKMAKRGGDRSSHHHRDGEEKKHRSRSRSRSRSRDRSASHRDRDLRDRDHHHRSRSRRRD